MKIITDGKAIGKTTKLIKYASEYGYYIVCANKRRVENIVTLARKLNIDINYPLTMNNIVNNEFYSMGIKGFVFDEIINCMRTLTHCTSIEAITMRTDK